MMIIFSTEGFCEICYRQQNIITSYPATVPASSPSVNALPHPFYQQQQSSSSHSMRMQSEHVDGLNNVSSASSPSSSMPRSIKRPSAEISQFCGPSDSPAASFSPSNNYINAGQSISEPSLSISQVDPTMETTVLQPMGVRVKTEEGGTMTVYESTRQEISRRFQRQHYHNYLFSSMEMNDGLLDDHGQQKQITLNEIQSTYKAVHLNPIIRNQLPLGVELFGLIKNNQLNGDDYFIQGMSACERLSRMKTSADIHHLRKRSFR